jgi:hypothetical protein
VIVEGAGGGVAATRRWSQDFLLSLILVTLAREKHKVSALNFGTFILTATRRCHIKHQNLRKYNL